MAEHQTDPDLNTVKVTRRRDVGDIPPGERVGPFRITRLIGRGGMGEVYAARDLELGRRVALKFIQLAPGSMASLEAVATARVSHPNIVTIHGTGHHEGRVYLVLELVEGRSLRERIKQERMPVMEVVRMAAAVADALAAAHAAGVVHRDIKPENILLGADGRPRLVDFGVADVVRRSGSEALAPTPGTSMGPDGDATITRRDAAGSETITGTPAYMAPEQWEQQAGPAADTWALGVVVYECLCGKRPFTQTQPALLYEAIRAEQPVDLSALRDVDPALRDIVAACLQKDAALRPDAAALRDRLTTLLGVAGVRGAGAESPFRGLLPFDERHAALFHGRDTEIDDLVERLRDHPRIGLVGPSGSGKSSLVHAGLVPRLRASGTWTVVSLRPGARPLHAMAAALDPADHALAAQLRASPVLLGMRLRARAESSSSRVLLVVDQLEEAVTLVPDPDERRAWLDALALAAEEPAEPVHLVFTLRDDFLGRVADASGSHDLLRQLLVVRAPGPLMLERAMRGPLELVGFRFEDPALLQAMVSEVAGETAALPLLQVAAHVMWEHRDETRRVLTRSSFQDMGGVAGAVARHADGVVDVMTPRMLTVTRALFLRLVTAQGTRQRLGMDTALNGLGPDGPAVLEKIRAARLVAVARGQSGDEVEVAHEALVHRWQRLSRWVDESRAARAELGEAQRAAERWRTRGRLPEDLWPGPRAMEARELARRTDLHVRNDDLLFLDESCRALLRSRRERAILRGAALGGALLLAVVAAGVAVLMSRKESEAQRGRQEALVQRADAEREGARAAMAVGRVSEARAKLRSSVETLDSMDARALHVELSRQPRMSSVPVGGALYDVASDPRGGHALVATQAGTLERVDAHGRHLGVLATCADQCISVAFAPDGREAYAGSWDGWLRAVNTADGSTRPLVRHPDAILRVAVGRGGVVASSSRDGTVHVSNPASGTQASPRVLPVRGRLLAFHPDGVRLALGDADGNVRLVSAADGAVLASVHAHDGPVRGLRFSSDGAVLASAGAESSRTWAVPGFSPLFTTRGPPGEVTSLALSADATRLFEGRPGTVVAWNLSSGRVDGTFHADGKITDMEVDAGGDVLWVASSGPDSQVQAWNLRVPMLAPGSGGARSPVYGVDISRDGRFIVAGGRGGTRHAIVYDARTGEPLHELEDPATGDFVRAVRFSPDGTRIVAAGGTSFTTAWHAPAGPVERHLPGHAREARDLAFSGDGRLLVTVGQDGVARVFETARWTEVTTVLSPPLRAVALDQDGGRMAIGGEARTVEVWGTRPRRKLHALEGHAGIVDGLAFSSDGRTLVSAGNDGEVRAWDLSTGKGRLVGRVDARIYAVELSPDGTVAYTSSSAGVCESWNPADGTRAVLGAHPAEVNRIALSADGAWMASSSDDGSVLAWRTRDGAPTWFGGGTLSTPPRVLTHRGWSTPGGATAEAPVLDGTRNATLVSQGGNTTCLLEADGLLHVASAGAARVFPGVRARVLVATGDGCLSLGPHGDSSVRAWPLNGEPHVVMQEARFLGPGGVVVTPSRVVLVDTGGTVRAEAAHAGRVVSAARHGDAFTLGFHDGHVDAGTSGLRGPSRAAVTALLHHDGDLLAAGHADGTVVLWHVPTAQVLDHVFLHGPVTHLAVLQGLLVALSARGDQRALDVDVFTADTCAFRARVAAAAPMRWSNGTLVPAEPSPGCGP